MQTLTPTAVRLNNLSGSAADLDDSPDAPDGSWCTQMPVINPDVLSSDTFETGDLSYTANGFYWGSRYVGPAGSFTDVASGVQSPFSSGSHSLQFHYEPDQSFCEQRYFIGGSYPELYVRYSLRIPSSLSAWGSNNKFFIIWTTPDIDSTYGGISPTINWGYTSGSGDLRLRLAYYPGDTDAGSVDDFVILPDDLGRWMEIVLRYKMSTSSGANNGIWQMWRRWYGESSHTQIANLSGLPWWDALSDGFSAGYIFGWANATFPSATDFYIDDLTFSTTSLVI